MLWDKDLRARFGIVRDLFAGPSRLLVAQVPLPDAVSTRRYAALPAFVAQSSSIFRSEFSRMGRRKLLRIHDEVAALHQALTALHYSKHGAYRAMAPLLGVSYNTVVRELEPNYREQTRVYDAQPDVRARRKQYAGERYERPGARAHHNAYMRQYRSMMAMFQESLGQLLAERPAEAIAASDIAQHFEQEFGMRPLDQTVRKKVGGYIDSDREPGIEEISPGYYRRRP